MVKSLRSTHCCTKWFFNLASCCYLQGFLWADLDMSIGTVRPFVLILKSFCFLLWKSMDCTWLSIWIMSSGCVDFGNHMMAFWSHCPSDRFCLGTVSQALYSHGLSRNFTCNLSSASVYILRLQRVSLLFYVYKYILIYFLDFLVTIIPVAEIHGLYYWTCNIFFNFEFLPFKSKELSCII